MKNNSVQAGFSAGTLLARFLGKIHIYGAAFGSRGSRASEATEHLMTAEKRWALGECFIQRLHFWFLPGTPREGVFKHRFTWGSPAVYSDHAIMWANKLKAGMGRMALGGLRGCRLNPSLMSRVKSWWCWQSWVPPTPKAHNRGGTYWNHSIWVTISNASKILLPRISLLEFPMIDQHIGIHGHIWLSAPKPLQTPELHRWELRVAAAEASKEEGDSEIIDKTNKLIRMHQNKLMGLWMHTSSVGFLWLEMPRVESGASSMHGVCTGLWLLLY